MVNLENNNMSGKVTKPMNYAKQKKAEVKGKMPFKTKGYICELKILIFLMSNYCLIIVS